MLEKILIAIISVIATAITGSIIRYLQTHRGKAVKKKKEEEKNARKEAVMECLEEIDLISQLKAINDSMTLLKKGVQSHIRIDLRDEYNKYIQKGYAPVSIREDLEHLYSAYHNLGKNGVMDSLREKFLALPTEQKKRISLKEDK